MSFGELGETKFIVTQNFIYEYQRALDNSKFRKTRIKANEWTEIVKQVDKLNLDSLESYKAPTNERQLDGAWYASMEICSNSSLYSTLHYDSGRPNKHLEDLHNVVNELILKYRKINWDRLYERAKKNEKEEKLSHIYEVVDIMPEFEGGKAAMESFIEKKKEGLAKNRTVSGKAFVQFVITKEGKITEIKVVKGDNTVVEKLAKKVVQSMPKWSPGKNRNQPVDVRVIIPIHF